MLVWLANYLTQIDSGFAVIQYITVRGIFSILTALMISLIIGPWMIRRLNYLQIGQVVRNDGPSSHFSKAGTPTMGGALILVSMLVSTLLWSDLSNHYVWTTLAVTLLFGAIGWVDDYRKVFEKNPKGLPARWKYFWQSVVGFGGVPEGGHFFVRRQNQINQRGVGFGNILTHHAETLTATETDGTAIRLQITRDQLEQG